MTAPLTLLAIACAIANNNSPRAISAAEALPAAEQVQVQQLMRSEACLPENFECLIRSSSEDANTGGTLLKLTSAPSDGCFAPGI